jgi:hypothetical protein
MTDIELIGMLAAIVAIIIGVPVGLTQLIRRFDPSYKDKPKEK